MLLLNQLALTGEKKMNLKEWLAMIGLSFSLKMNCHHHHIVMIGPNFITIKIIIVG